MKIDLKNCLVKLKDGGSNSITLKVGEGTLSWTAHAPREYVKDRGILDTVRNGDQEPVDIKFDLIWEFLVAEDGGDAPTPFEVLNHIGAAEEWETSDSDDPCAPYAIDIEITHTPPCDDVDPEVITFPKFRHESIDGDAKAGTLSVSGKANVILPTIERAAASS